MQLTGSQALIRALELEGVDTIFGLPGGCILPVYDPLLDSPLPWTRMRRVYALLGLVRRYGAARVTEGCTLALGADLLDVHRLKRMLEQGAAAPPPTPPARVIPLGRYLRPASQYRLPFRAAAEGEESQ